MHTIKPLWTVLYKNRLGQTKELNFGHAPDSEAQTEALGRRFGHAVCVAPNGDIHCEYVNNTYMCAYTY